MKKPSAVPPPKQRIEPRPTPLEEHILRVNALALMRRLVMTKCTMPALTALLNGAIDAIEKL